MLFSMITFSGLSSKSSNSCCKRDSFITSCNSVLWLLEKMIQTSLLFLMVLSLSSFRPFSTFTYPSQDRYVEFYYPQKLSGSSCAVEPKEFSSHDPSRFIQVNGLELSGFENNLVRLVNGLKHLIAIWNNLPGEQQHQQDGGEASPNRDDQQQQGSGEEGVSAHNGDDKSGEDRDDQQQQGSGEEGGSAHNGDDKSGDGAEDDEDLQGEGSRDAGEEEVVEQQEVPPEDVQLVKPAQPVQPVQPENGWCNTTWNKEDDRKTQRRAREMKHFSKKSLQYRSA